MKKKSNQENISETIVTVYLLMIAGIVILLVCIGGLIIVKILS